MELYDDDNIDYMFLLHGFKYGKEPLSLKDFRISYDELLGIVLKFSDVNKNNECDRETMIQKTKTFFYNNFSLRDILYMSHDMTVELCEDFLSNSNDDLDGFQNKLNDISKTISPFDLPISYIKGATIFGNLLNEMLLIRDEQFMKEQQIRFSELQLGARITPFTSILYGHEIIHTQLEGIKGSIENLHNREVLPIFMENVLSFEFDSNNELLRQNMFIRYKDMLNDMLRLAEPEFYMDTDLHLASGYINSVLKASNLFDKYVSSSLEERSKMLHSVQNVFDGKCTVEDFLCYYDVTLENSSNLVVAKKYLIK